MTTYIAYLLKFIFRIKWWLIICPILVALFVYQYMGGMSRTYKSSTTIYTGIVSGYSPESNDSRQDWNTINNAMDNLINIIMSQTTLHNVSLRLYARSMSHGNSDKNNNYILAKNYRGELAHTPKAVKDLIVRNDEDQTYENLSEFEKADHDNHVYGLFHWTHRYYSYQALSQIKVRRVNNSDMLEVTYENSDPGIVYNTLDILNDEFVKQYRELRFGETNNVIAFFERELARVGGTLNNQEDSLRDYSIENKVINYDEQTKHIAALSRDFELKYEETRLSYNSAEKVRATLESQLDGIQVFRNNAAFINRLHRIGDLQSRITSTEAFTNQPDPEKPATKTSTNADRLRIALARETDTLRQITSTIATQKYTKEGLTSSSLVQQWLEATLLSARTKAELDVLDSWSKSLDLRYEQYAPVGSTLTRKKRLINFTEQSYLSLLQALNTARLRQKNLQMTSATLKIINPPVLPISAEPTKRKLTVIAAFFGTALFILGFFILLELLDRTLRDKIRAERITEGKVIGAFPGPGRLRQRRFQQQYRQIATRQLGNALLDYFAPGKTRNVINILSTAQGDGKSLIAEQLANYLRETGMKVRLASWNKDFKAEQRDYLLAVRPEEFISDTADDATSLADADVLIVEYPPLGEYSIPSELLRSACVNLVCAPANRTWKSTDQSLFEKNKQLAGNSPVVLCLNYASRDTVQTFTGLLPPYSFLRKIGYQISQFGFTAVK